MGFMIFIMSLLAFLITIIAFRDVLQKERVKSTQISWMSSKLSYWDEDLDKNIWDRIVLPALKRFRVKLKQSGQKKTKTRISKRQTQTRLDDDLRKAGITLSSSEFTVLRIVITIVVVLAGILVATRATRDTAIQFLILLGFVSIAVAAPTFILRGMVKSRTLLMQNQMPNVMDVLSVSIEAGLGFDAALYKVLERFDGPLIDELGLVYREIQMGVPRRDALRALAKRSNLPEIQTFATAVIQAEQYGTPIKNVLRQQAIQLRVARKQNAQEKGMKAPVRILIPMLIFIFPVIFIILLGPTIITAIGDFS
jgi:tight adherence protein C